MVLCVILDETNYGSPSAMNSNAACVIKPNRDSPRRAAELSIRLRTRSVMVTLTP
jgi:hypothetical protein